LTNDELIESCIAAYVGTVGDATKEQRFGTAPRSAMFGFTAAAHRLAVTALPPARPTRMPPQQFEFPGLPVLGAVRRAFRSQPAAPPTLRPETASH
jgi:hypothetical protein